MSRVMILPSFGVWPMLEYELDIVQRRIDSGDDIVWLMCEGNAPFCPANLKMKKRICMECKSRTQAGLKWLEHRGKLTVASLYNLNNAQRDDTKIWAENTSNLPSDLASVDWYESSFSTLQTTYKEFRPNLAKYDLIFRRMIIDFFQSYVAFQNNLHSYEPDEVWLFNGRITRFRPALRTLQGRSSKFFVYEYPYQGFKRYLVVEGQYPHDFGFRSKTWKKNFDTHPLPLEKKLAIGNVWYQKRLARIPTNYEKVFSDLQIKNLLPRDWKSARCNITVFNSSEWESAGVPESRRWNYEEQYQAIERIAQDTKHLTNLHFTIRIHPQMQKNDKLSSDKFLTLKRFSNISVLEPESKYDTYALVTLSDIVITFYSLVGVESAWLGKKVICLGPAPYQDFGCVYLPHTHDELMETLSNLEKFTDRFPPIEMRKQGAQKFAFARLFSGTKPRYLVKNHFSRAMMRRKSVSISIRAALPLYILNRFIAFPINIVDTAKRVYSDPFLRKEIIQDPWSSIVRFLRDRISGLTP